MYAKSWFTMSNMHGSVSCFVSNKLFMCTMYMYSSGQKMLTFPYPFAQFARSATLVRFQSLPRKELFVIESKRAFPVHVQCTCTYWYTVHIQLYMNRL